MKKLLFLILIALMEVCNAQQLIVNPIPPMSAPLYLEPICRAVCPGPAMDTSFGVAISVRRCPPSMDPQLGVYAAYGWRGWRDPSCTFYNESVCPSDGCFYDVVDKPPSCPPGFDYHTPTADYPTYTCRRSTSQFDPNKHNCCSGNGTNPVHTATGVKHQVESDFTISERNNLVFKRYYTSYDKMGYSEPKDERLGIHWTHNLNRRIFSSSFRPRPYVSVLRGDGSVYVFKSVNNAWIPEPDVHITLTGC